MHKMHKVQLACGISKPNSYQTCIIASLLTLRPSLKIFIQEKKSFPRITDGQTDGQTDRQTDNRLTDRQTDRQTDGQTSRTTTIRSFFEEGKAIKNDF